MDGLCHFLVALLGVVSCSQDWISRSVLEVTVRPGDNITLYCDCKKSTGVYIVWYRNCSHENQPSLVLKQSPKAWRETMDSSDYLNQNYPHFRFVINISSESSDLLIMNITDSDEGLYYCGTEEMKVKDEKYINPIYIYRYGNVTTRIIFNSSEPQRLIIHDCGVCWMLLYSLCPAFAVLSSLLSSLLVYQLCHKSAKETKADTRGQTRRNKDEDVCYAALEIRQTSQRPNKKKTQSSDFTTYSAINTSRM